MTTIGFTCHTCGTDITLTLPTEAESLNLGGWALPVRKARGMPKDHVLAVTAMDSLAGATTHSAVSLLCLRRSESG